ncbi:protein DOG1-like 4 [Vicia villosa]|uniref:protein DOG1-like 4 n=1 Tax=Vicia villosa TaxID=3911 RepID=UPI00273BFCF7|nr:protein DOG1-like 4 [Vicia villosa]
MSLSHLAMRQIHANALLITFFIFRVFLLSFHLFFFLHLLFLSSHHKTTHYPIHNNRNKQHMLEMKKSFSEFYEKWISKLEEIHHQLLKASKREMVMNEQELQALVSKVTTHLKEYYTVKWNAAHEDVVVFFSPTWVTPLENASLWITGWKPSTVFRVLEKFDMSDEEKKKIEGLKMKTKMEEEKVEGEMERQQVAMADLKMVKLAKISCRGRKDDARVDGLVDVALNGVFGGLEKVMKSSDCVRLKTVKGVLDVLSPIQSVHFLAAHIGMQLRLRQLGMNKITQKDP